MHHDELGRTPPRHRKRRFAPAAPAAPAAVVLAAGLLGACVDPQREVDRGAERAAAEAALDSGYATFSEAYDQANVQLLMNEVYAPDAFYLPPGSPILEGQDQFRGQFSFLERYARGDGPGPRIAFEVIDRQIDGDLASDIGIFTLHAPDDAPEAEGARGKFVVIWKRSEDGEWRIHADAFSPVE